jgi:uncharacterized membrane protein YfcA
VTASQPAHYWLLGLPMAIGGICTVSWGVAWAHRLPERRLRTVFALMLIATAILMLYQSR